MSKLILSLIFLVYSAFCWGQSSLHYTLNEGDRFVVVQDAEQLITQELEGVTHQLENKINGVMEFTVTDTIEDQYLIDIIFTDLGMNMSSNLHGELMSVDASQLIEGDIQSQIFHSLLNVPIRMILSRSGNVLEVQGGDSLITRMTMAAGLENIEAQNALRATLEDDFGSEALSSSFKQMTYFYPEDTKDTDPSTWTNEYTGKLSAKNSWTLEKATDTLNIIKGKADIILNVANEGTTMYLNGIQETTINVDPDNGFILDMLVEGFSEGTATTAMTGTAEIPTTIKSTTTYKLIQE